MLSKREIEAILQARKTIVRKGNDKDIMLISNFKVQYVFILIHIFYLDILFKFQVFQNRQPLLVLLSTRQSYSFIIFHI